MALQIGTSCFSCYACETVCPSGAIKNSADTFVIDAALCNECPDLQTPRCMAICPEPNTITKKE